MFDRIAPRYDLLNHLLSGGQDWLWRRALARRLHRASPGLVVDVATGTGDQLIAVLQAAPELRGLGFDLAPAMLARGAAKLQARGLSERAFLQLGDACALPLPDAAADYATIAFGIRNVESPAAGLRELHRVLKPGGQLFVLEFGLPPNRWLRHLYLLYFRHVLPRLGGLLSGDVPAYRYLNRSVETFPCGEAFLALLREAGFAPVSARPLTCGVAMLYQGTKP